MIWNIMICDENEQYMFISYSQDDDLDGVMRYDKKTQELKIIKNSHDCDEYDQSRAKYFVLLAIDKNVLTKEKCRIVTG